MRSRSMNGMSLEIIYYNFRKSAVEFPNVKHLARYVLALPMSAVTSVFSSVSRKGVNQVKAEAEAQNLSFFLPFFIRFPSDKPSTMQAWLHIC